MTLIDLLVMVCLAQTIHIPNPEKTYVVEMPLRVCCKSETEFY